MERIASMTVIRGEGGCEATYNKIVSEEIQRLNAEHAAREARLHAEYAAAEADLRQRYAAKENELRTVRDSRNRLLRDRKVPEFRRPNRLLDRLETAWAAIWMLGIRIGLWGYADDE